MEAELTMFWAFDHLVHFVASPDEAKHVFQRKGFRTVKGGSHENWGTHNALCYFQEFKYIEWIGLSQPHLAEKADNPLIRQIVRDAKDGEGFSQLAFRVENTEQMAEVLRQRGLTPAGPFPGKRKKPDGSEISWSMLFVEDDLEDFRYPFFICWENEEKRQASLLSFLDHGGKKPELTFIGFQTCEPGKPLQKFLHLFGMNERSLVKGFDGFGHYLAFSPGNIELRFYKHEKGGRLGSSGRPFLCGISGTGISETFRWKNSLYQLTP
jgi:hypothetical protein